MRIACLSGKGGAGKTLVAVNLAAVGADTYIDCDVEEPNGRLFLRPEAVEEEPVCTLLPAFDGERCTGCRRCVSFCRFHALMYIKEKPMVFPEVCHSCGGCLLVCPEQAIREEPRKVGCLELGRRGNLQVVTGVLDPGEASGVPVIRAALEKAQGLTVVDCPPGSACGVLESVSAADFCLLVAEPTAFGFHNFQMVHQLVELLGKPCGVVINRETAPYVPLEDYCRDRGLPVLAHIPEDPEIAALAAAGEIAAEHKPEVRALFAGLLRRIGGAV